MPFSSSLFAGPKARFLAVLALWSAVVVLGFRRAFSYSGTAGASADASAAWPADAGFALDSARPTLVLFAHPHCPCTRATLDELDRLVARSAGALRIHVLVYADPALGAGWERTDLWDHALAIPGADVAADPLGCAAARFGARTSGQVFLYAPSGELLFEGGITPARGHEGDNAGVDAIVAYTRGEVPAVRATPVFGCSLFADPRPEDARP